MIESLQELLGRHIEDETRESAISLPVPGLGSIGLLPPHPIFWLQLVAVLGIQSIINTITAVAAYFLILKNRGSPSSYMVGYGFLLPFLLIFPLKLSLALRLHNMAMLTGQAASMNVILFRCMMTMHGTLPAYVEQDLKTFVLFFLSPVQFAFDSKMGQVYPASSQDIGSSMWKTLKSLVVLTVVLGVMVQTDFELFPRREVKTFFDLFYWGNLCNNYAMAYLTGVCLDAGTRIVGTGIECVSGTKVIEVSDNPLTHSSSPSDFWGRRWNALVHLVLKGGVYVPLRQNGFGKGIAAFVTFASSGVFHEYVLTMIALKGVMLEDHSAYKPQYGAHLIFFAWNGVVLMLESLFYKHPSIQEMKRMLPSPVITALVILTVLPVGHWFTDEYAQVGFYNDFAVGFPHVVWAPLRYRL